MVRISLRKDEPAPDAPPPKPVPDGAAHEKVVPAGTTAPVGVYEKATAVHVEVVCVVKDGAGATVTETVKTDPWQLPNEGVTV